MAAVSPAGPPPITAQSSTSAIGPPRNGSAQQPAAGDPVQGASETGLAVLHTGAERLRRSGLSGRILVVEDDVDTADYVSKGLREAGYTVEHVADGRDGLYLASSSAFDAVVMDRMLPGMDGLSVVKALRAAGA